MAITFSLTVFAWIFFRAESVDHAFAYIGGIFSSSLFSLPIQEVKDISNGARIVYIIMLVIGFVLFEWFQRDKQHALEMDSDKVPGVCRWGLYYGVLALIIYFQGSQQTFIYFQF